MKESFWSLNSFCRTPELLHKFYCANKKRKPWDPTAFAGQLFKDSMNGTHLTNHWYLYLIHLSSNTITGGLTIEMRFIWPKVGFCFNVRWISCSASQTGLISDHQRTLHNWFGCGSLSCVNPHFNRKNQALHVVMHSLLLLIRMSTTENIICCIIKILHS